MKIKNKKADESSAFHRKRIDESHAFLKQRKAQGLPIKTVVLVILALLVLAVVAIWYLTYSGKISAASFDFLSFSENKTKLKCSFNSDCPNGYECCDQRGECIPIGTACTPPT
jgi:hypothetical protein